MCKYDCRKAEDWCSQCGSYLGLLKRSPRHIAKCVTITIGLGIGLFLALGWHVFMPLLEGWPAGQPEGWFWAVLCLATFLLALGLRARQNLRETLSRVAVRLRREAQEAVAATERETPHSSGAGV